MTLAPLQSTYDVHSACIDPESGLPRLRVARSYFHGLQQIDIENLIEVFQYWQTFEEYLVLKAENTWTGEQKGVAVLCSKRGNEVYASRMRKRLDFLNHGKDVIFFSPGDFKTDQKVFTQVLWVTLTFDSKHCGLEQAWQEDSYFKDLFLQNLRNRYGKISYVDFPQAFPDPDGQAYGYPHHHMIMLFHEARFQVFPNLETDRDGVTSLKYRVQEKDQLADQGKWHSFIDVQALSSMGAVHNYAMRYCENVAYGESQEATINNAMLWLFKKKGFNVSGDFRVTYHDLIKSLRNSKQVFQFSLGMEKLPGVVSEWKYSLVGVKPLNSIARVKKFDPGPAPWFVMLSLDELDLIANPRFEGMPRARPSIYQISLPRGTSDMHTLEACLS